MEGLASSGIVCNKNKKKYGLSHFSSNDLSFVFLYYMVLYKSIHDLYVRKPTVFQSHVLQGHPTTLYCTDKVTNAPDGVELRPASEIMEIDMEHPVFDSFFHLEEEKIRMPHPYGGRGGFGGKAAMN